MTADIEFHHRTPRSDTVVVAVSGEVDTLTGPQLCDRLADACRALPPGGQVVADMRSVSFLGCSGLNALVTALETAQRRGKHLRVVADRPEVLQPLRLTMLDRKLSVDATLGDALTSH
ncbi:STAS domain-containing protein [Amycolatopsis thermoflava]|uniref:STAS domain-containing protein n=1 Tax=Amycolatopsis thermoflava TaxID=84480 RepID=UPI003EC10EDD